MLQRDRDALLLGLLGHRHIHRVGGHQTIYVLPLGIQHKLGGSSTKILTCVWLLMRAWVRRIAAIELLAPKVILTHSETCDNGQRKSGKDGPIDVRSTGVHWWA